MALLVGPIGLVACSSGQQLEPNSDLRERTIGTRTARHQKLRQFSTAVQTCMRAEGFSYPDVDLVKVGTVTLTPPPGLFLDPIELQTYGYGISKPVEKDPVLEYMMTLAPEQKVEFTRAWKECLQKNASITTVDIPEALSVRLSESLKRANSDDRVVSMLRQWRSCMASEGFPFESSAAIREDLGRQMRESSGLTGTGVPGKREQDAIRAERSVALIDYECTKPHYNAYMEILRDYDGS